MRSIQDPPVRRIVVIVCVCVFAVLHLGCSAEHPLSIPPLVDDSSRMVASEGVGSPDAFALLPLVTPDGSGQTVHPDYAVMPAWTPRRYLVATPYTWGSSKVENPFLYAQTPEYAWRPAGPGSLAFSKSGYLSDPDIVALPDKGELWIYYREITTLNSIWLLKSTDGVTWSEPRPVVSAPNHMLVSPAVVRRDSRKWLMWSVNAGKGGCGAYSTTVELRWSADGMRWFGPATVDLVQKPFYVWHIDVQWIPSRQEYWALYNVKTENNCNTRLLYLATSPDGMHWTTYPSPVLSAGVVPEFADIVYRSTFAYSPKTDRVRFWFSGGRASGTNFIWQTAYQSRTRAELFNSIGRPDGALRALRVAGKRGTLLIDPP